MKGLAILGDGSLVSVVQALCNISNVRPVGSISHYSLRPADRLQAQEADVCDGAIAREGPIIAKALRKMTVGSRASKELCTTLLGACAYPAVTPWDVPFPSPKPKRQRPPPSGKKPLKIVHYSDIHVDTSYMPGSSTDCKKPICCR